MNHHEYDEMPDPEKIKELLDVISEKIPGLLKSLSDVLYGPEQAKNYAQATAIYFKELKEAGMTDDQAYQLTRDYMANLNIGGMVGNIAKNSSD